MKYEEKTDKMVKKSQENVPSSHGKGANRKVSR